MRDVAQVQAIFEIAVQEARGSRQVLLGLLNDFLVAEDAEVDLRLAQVWGCFDVDDRDQWQRQRLFVDLARQEIGILLTQQVLDAFNAARGHTYSWGVGQDYVSR